MWEAIRSNKRRSIFLIATLAMLLIGLGYAIGFVIAPQYGYLGIAAASVIWLVLFLTAILGGRQVLLMSSHAREIQHDDCPRLFNVVEEMTIAAGLPKRPKVYILDCDAPNAFAVGTPENSAVAVTTGLLTQLNRDELQGVVAHEIGHIKNEDTKFMTLAGVMVAAIVILADSFLRGMFYSGRGRRRSSYGRGGGQVQALIIVAAIVFAILAPLFAQLLYFACSRRREFLADASAARFTRYPEGLASALEKISGSAKRMPKVNRAIAPMFTVNPLQRSAVSSLFSTHPSALERVRILRSMGSAGYAQYEAAYAKVRQGQHIIGEQTLSQADAPAVREPSAEPEPDDLAKGREAVDILHRMEGLLFLTCACGMRMKVPKQHKGDKVPCPACGRVMGIPAPAIVAAAVVAAEAAERADRKARPTTPPRRQKLAYAFKPGQWQSFRCPCGNTIQLSPSFKADKTTCPDCERQIQISRS